MDQKHQKHDQQKNHKNNYTIQFSSIYLLRNLLECFQDTMELHWFQNVLLYVYNFNTISKYMTGAFSIIQTYCSVKTYEIFFLCNQGGTFFFLFWIFTDSSYLHQILYFYQTRHHQIMQNFCMPQIHVKNPT